MNRNRKSMGRKKCLKMMGVLLASAMVTAGTGTQAVYASGQDSHIEKSDKEYKEARVIYLDGQNGSDSNGGTSAKKAVKTFRKAASLAGEEGKILVCGTVTVDGEETWQLPEGVTLRAAEEFSDPLVCVNGSLKLENVRISEDQITGDGEVEGAIRESLVKVPEVISVEQPVPLSEISLKDCEGKGTFSWEKGDQVPSAWETVYQVIFRPEDPDAEDYSQEEGWQEESGVVIRQVTVRVLSLKKTENNPETAVTPEAGENQTGSGESGQTQENGTSGENPGKEDSLEGGSSAAETGEDKETGQKTDGSGQTSGEGTQTPQTGTADAGSEGSTQPQTGTDTPAGGADTENGNQAAGGSESGQNGDAGSVTGGQEGPAADGGEGSANAGATETPGNGSQQTQEGTGNLPEAGTETPEAGTGTPGAGTDTPESGTAVPGGETGQTDTGDQTPAAPDAGNSPSGQTPSPEQGGLTEQEQRQVADVQARLTALPQQVASQEDVNLVVEATRAYLSLNDMQREKLIAESVRYLEAMQQQAAIFNRTSNGLTIEGDFPWYVQFRVQENSQGEQLALPQNSGADTVIAPYDMMLWDLMNQQEYHLNGQQVRITMPAPDMELFSQLVVLHYLEDGSVEYITPVNNSDGTISFLTTSFSPYNLAGSQVLVGNTNWLYTPAVTGGSSSSSGNKGSVLTSQSSTSANSKNSSGTSSAKSSQTSSKTTSSGRQSVSSGNQSTSLVNRVVATNDPQTPLLYAGLGAAALIILAGAAVGVKKSAGRRKEAEETKE